VTEPPAPPRPAPPSPPPRRPPAASRPAARAAGRITAGQGISRPAPGPAASPAPNPFYDELAEVYHLIYPDWAAARQSQARVFAALLAAEGMPPGSEVLDCAAGIGTQALGLAAAGYRVTATDACLPALRRLAREARALNLHLRTRPCDIRDLAGLIRLPRDVVMAVDNAVPHLLSEEEIAQALRAVGAVLKPGGLLLLSMRDFDRCLDGGERPFGEGPFIHEETPPRRILYQVWDWRDERVYDAHLYITWQVEGAGEGAAPPPWRVHHGVTRYRALRRAELSHLARNCGFTDCTWRMPDETGFYQPVLLARRQ